MDGSQPINPYLAGNYAPIVTEIDTPDLPSTALTGPGYAPSGDSPSAP